MSKLMSKLNDTSETPSAANPMARSLSSNQHTNAGMPMDLEAKTAESILKHTTSYEMSRVQQSTQPEALSGSRTEKVIANFLQNPLFQNDTKMDFRDVVCTKTLLNCTFRYCSFVCVVVASAMSSAAQVVMHQIS